MSNNRSGESQGALPQRDSHEGSSSISDRVGMDSHSGDVTNVSTPRNGTADNPVRENAVLKAQIEQMKQQHHQALEDQRKQYDARVASRQSLISTLNSQLQQSWDSERINDQAQEDLRSRIEELEKDCAEKAATIELMKPLHASSEEVRLHFLQDSRNAAGGLDASRRLSQHTPPPLPVAQAPPASEIGPSSQHVPSPAVPNLPPNFEGAPRNAHASGGLKVLRVPQEPKKPIDFRDPFVPGFVNGARCYISQIPRIYEYAISYHQERGENIKHRFLRNYDKAGDNVIDQHEELHPLGQQYELEKQLWQIYVGPPHATFNGFPCPDPMPYIRGEQCSNCDICDRPGHWWFRCPETECTRCGESGHRYPGCLQDVTWVVTRRALLASTAAAATASSQPPPPSQSQSQSRPPPQL